MVLIAATAIAAATPQAEPVGTAPVVEARATVRILSGFRLRPGAAPERDAPPVRETTIRYDGVERPANLIEFQ